METTGVSQLTFQHSIKTDVTEVSNNNNCEIGMLDDNGNQNKEEDLNLGDTIDDTFVQLNNLFQKGQEYEQNCKPVAALQCYLGCIKALKHRNTIDHLPQCIHKVTEIYRTQQQNGHSVQLAQTEQLLSEAGIRDIDDIQQIIDKIAEDVKPGIADLNELNIDAVLAKEYENMAKECWLKQQYELAMKYACRSFKLKHQMYGWDSPKVTLSMKLFAAICLEFNHQHNPGIIKHTRELDNYRGSASMSPEVIMAKPSSGKPVSILRQRSKGRTKETDREKKQVRFHKSVEEKLQQKEKADEMVSVRKMFVALTLFVMVVAFLGMWIVCFIEMIQKQPTFLLKFQK